MEAAGFIRAAEAVPGAERTGFARKYVSASKAIFSASFRRPRTARVIDSNWLSRIVKSRARRAGLQ